MFVPQHNRNSELRFDDDNLVLCCLDLFLAGSETTSKTLQWGLIYLINNAQIQGGCSHQQQNKYKSNQRRSSLKPFYLTS